MDHAALPSYCITAALVLPRDFLREQGIFLSLVRDDERVTLGEVCAKLRDYQERLSPRPVSGSSDGSASTAEEPIRSSPPPLVHGPTAPGATGGRPDESLVTGAPSRKLLRWRALNGLWCSGPGGACTGMALGHENNRSEGVAAVPERALEK